MCEPKDSLVRLRMKNLAAVSVLAGLVVAAQPVPVALATEGDVVIVDSTDVPVVVTAPYPPGQVEAVAGASGATVTWTPPEDDGGESITGYLVQFSADDGVTWTGSPDAGPDATSSFIDGLDNGVAYVFQVTRERIRQIEARALQKLKDPRSSSQLVGFLD